MFGSQGKLKSAKKKNGKYRTKGKIHENVFLYIFTDAG
jgi:hypothetical protein